MVTTPRAYSGFGGEGERRKNNRNPGLRSRGRTGAMPRSQNFQMQIVLFPQDFTLPPEDRCRLLSLRIAWTKFRKS